MTPQFGNHFSKRAPVYLCTVGTQCAMCYSAILGFLTSSVYCTSFDSTVSQDFPQYEIAQKIVWESCHKLKMPQKRAYFSAGISSWLWSWLVEDSSKPPGQVNSSSTFSSTLPKYSAAFLFHVCQVQALNHLQLLWASSLEVIQGLRLTSQAKWGL